MKKVIYIPNQKTYNFGMNEVHDFETHSKLLDEQLKLRARKTK